jgi:hypothetical protein
MTRRGRRAPHLLAVVEPAARFAPLVQALAAAGMRTGWLELRPPEAMAPSLAAAVATGVGRAVAVGGSHSMAVKAMAGAPVLRDLLREHFAGCAVVLVLVSGSSAAAMPPDDWEMPLLAPDDGDSDAWAVKSAAGDPSVDAVRHLDTAGLVARLRRPHPWSKPASAEKARQSDGPA